MARISANTGTATLDDQHLAGWRLVRGHRGTAARYGQRPAASGACVLNRWDQRMGLGAYRAGASARPRLFALSATSRWKSGGCIFRHIGFTYLPFMNNVFETAPIGIPAWGSILVLGLIV